MTDMQRSAAFARRALLGFACLQGFIVALLYIGPNRMLVLGPIGIERGDIACVLAFMTCGFIVIARGNPALVDRLSSRASLVACTAVLVVAGIASFALNLASPWAIVAEGALLGLPCAVVLALWGRALGALPVEHSVPLFFIASALGAAVCFVVGAGLMPIAPASEALLCLLPVGSAAALLRLGVPDGGSRLGGEPEPSAAEQAPEEARFTKRIFAGTAIYGAATGIMQTFGSDPGMPSTPSLPVTFVLFILYCIASLQVVSPDADAASARPAQGALPGLGSALLEKGREVAQGSAAGPINGAYRLSGLLLLGGFLFVGVLEDVGVPGEAVVVAGFLAVMAVLGALFLIMARLSLADAARMFARGYAALFAGEFLGIVLANAIDLAPLSAGAGNVMVALAGLGALIAYLFLFTEQDFTALSVAAEKADRLEETCAALARRLGLSPREAEVLPLAIKGRTNERIASELCISKSTVDTHLRRIYAKCGVHSRQELIDLFEAER